MLHPFKAYVKGKFAVTVLAQESLDCAILVVSCASLHDVLRSAEDALSQVIHRLYLSYGDLGS
jgi:hypothetical protein